MSANAKQGNARHGAIALEDLLTEIEVPTISVPEMGVSDFQNLPLTQAEEKDLFAEKKRAAWKQVQTEEARCDFAPNKVRISYRNPAFGIISLWKKSIFGRTLTDIKGDDNMVPYFASNMVHLIHQVLGSNLSSGDWCIVTSPKRRHKQHNFASRISQQIADALGIPFYEDLALCHSRHRIGAVFTLGKEPPPQRNIIVFDDFVTSGSTMIAMYNLLAPLGYNLVFFTGINNKL